MQHNYVPHFSMRSSSSWCSTVFSMGIGSWANSVQGVGFTQLAYGANDCTSPTSLSIGNGWQYHSFPPGEYMRLEARWAGELFQLPLLLSELVMPSWIKHIWITANNFHIRIQSGFPDLHKPHYGDVKLIHLFWSNGYCHTSDLVTLNQCQMYLKAFWLLDICNGSGTHIESHLWNNPHPLESPWIWPWLILPSSSDWHLWQLGLTGSLHLSQNQQLAQPLSLWILSGSPSGWFMNPNWIGFGTPVTPSGYYTAIFHCKPRLSSS